MARLTFARWRTRYGMGSWTAWHVVGWAGALRTECGLSTERHRMDYRLKRPARICGRCRRGIPARRK